MLNGAAECMDIDDDASVLERPHSIIEAMSCRKDHVWSDERSSAVMMTRMLDGDRVWEAIWCSDNMLVLDRMWRMWWSDRGLVGWVVAA